MSVRHTLLAASVSVIAFAMSPASAQTLSYANQGELDQMIRQAYDIAFKDYAYIPLHQQSLSWGLSKKVKLTQRADNQVLLYWATKQEE